MPLSNRDKQSRFRARQRRAGLKQTLIYLPPQYATYFQTAAATIAQLASEHQLDATEFMIYYRDSKGRVHPLKELT